MSQFQKFEAFYFKTSHLDRVVIFLTCLFLGFSFIDPIFYQLSTYANLEIKEFSGYISHFGRGGVVLVPCGLLFLFALFMNNQAATIRLRAFYIHIGNLTGYLFFTVASAGLIALFFKNVLGRARPKYFENFGSFYFDPLSFDPSLASFPSGHATTSFACAVALSLVIPKLRFTVISVAFWIALSRYLIGAHYMSDIIVGGVLGSCIAIYVKRYLVLRGVLFKVNDQGVSRIQGAYILAWYFRNHVVLPLNWVFKKLASNLYFKPVKIFFKNSGLY